MRSIEIQLVVASLSALLVRASLAQDWTFVHLHAGGGDLSGCTDASGGQQSGYASTASGQMTPSIWTGSADSWRPLNTPGDYADAYAYGIEAGQVVGMAEHMEGMPGVSVGHACLWTAGGTFVDLHPADATYSAATGISGSQQVGSFYTPDGQHYAAMWSGSAASLVVLHPAGATTSTASDCYLGQQVGVARISGRDRAGLWTGTAESWTDLHPAGATGSVAYGVYAGEQVGVCLVNGGFRACLWHGTAASWVDLAPAGSTSSTAYATYEGMQVGAAGVGGVRRASLWRGSADSWVDLSAYLPSEFSESSSASSISSDGAFIYVVGRASTPSGSEHAVMWKTPVPCEGDLDGNRIVNLQDLAVLLSHYGTPEGATSGDGDLDGDGDVDLQDLTLLLARFGSMCL